MTLYRNFQENSNTSVILGGGKLPSIRNQGSVEEVTSHLHCNQKVLPLQIPYKMYLRLATQVNKKIAELAKEFEIKSNRLYLT